jgi:hypothetical protein
MVSSVFALFGFIQFAVTVTVSPPERFETTEVRKPTFWIAQRFTVRVSWSFGSVLTATGACAGLFAVKVKLTALAENKLFATAQDDKTAAEIKDSIFFMVIHTLSLIK